MPHSFALSFVASFLEDRDVRCVSELSRSVRQELSTAVLWERRFLERPLLKGLWGSHARLLLACGDGLGTQPWYLAKCFAEEPLQVLQSVTARCEMPFVDIPPDAEQIHPIGAVMGGIQQSALHWRHVTALCEKKVRVGPVSAVFVGPAAPSCRLARVRLNEAAHSRKCGLHTQY